MGADAKPKMPQGKEGQRRMAFMRKSSQQSIHQSTHFFSTTELFGRNTPFSAILSNRLIFNKLCSELHIPPSTFRILPCETWPFAWRSLTFHLSESTYKKCLREEWGKFTGYQLLSSFWLKVARTDEDGNTTRWDRGTLPIRNLYPKWRMLRFGRMRKVTNWIWTLWFIVSYWWVT